MSGSRLLQIRAILMRHTTWQSVILKAMKLVSRLVNGFHEEATANSRVMQLVSRLVNCHHNVAYNLAIGHLKGHEVGLNVS